MNSFHSPELYVIVKYGLLLHKHITIMVYMQSKSKSMLSGIRFISRSVLVALAQPYKLIPGSCGQLEEG